MTKIIPTLVLTLALAAPLLALADICDDVNEIANGWNDMANAIHSVDPSQITDADAEQVDASIREAFGATEEFANLLVNEGNDQEAFLGEDLHGALGVLWDTQDGSIEELIAGMDTVVDSLDGITDYCDQL